MNYLSSNAVASSMLAPALPVISKELGMKPGSVLELYV
jgi:hypothetical protein